MSDQKKTDGGPAFPFPAVTGLPNGDFFYGWNGMTLRDYFANGATVPIGICERHAEGLIGRKMPNPWIDPLGNAEFWAEFEARSKYIKADAMLKAREQ